MSDLATLLNQSALHRLGWALIHSLWQGAVAAMVFGLLRTALRRRSANARYAVACVMLALIAVAPVLTMVIGKGGTSGWPLEPARDAISSPVADATYAGEPAGAWGEGTGTRYEAVVMLERLLPWVVLGWLLGVGGLSCRWIWGSWWVRSLKMVGTAPVGERWLKRLEDIKDRLNISRPVQLLRSSLVEVPMVVGLLRPVILLPASTLCGLTPAQLDAILAHELAHIRRLDYLVNSFQNLVETLMFYHPAVWWISRCIREERELCCDDLVVSVCGDRVDYARALYTLETLRGHPRLAFAASGGSLLCRIRRLMGTAPDSRPASARELGGLALVGIGCVLVVSGALLLFRPATYHATAVIKLMPGPSKVSASGGTHGSRIYYDPYFVQTELAVIRSPAVLRRVIAALRPASAGGSLPETVSPDRIRSRVAIQQVPGTALLEIGASDDSAAGAAHLANVVANAYEQYRAEQGRSLLQQGIEHLQNRLAEIDAQVAEAQKKAEQMRLDLRISALDQTVPDGENAVPVLLTAETLRRLETLRIESQADLVRQRTLLERLKKLSEDELPQAILVAAPDTLLSALLEQLSLAEQKLLAFSKDFGPHHLECVKVSAQVSDMQGKVRHRTQGIMLGLDAKVQSLAENLKRLEEEVNEAARKDKELAIRIAPYREATRNLDELKRFRQVLFQKIDSERTDLEFSALLSGLIVEPAVAPQTRVSPNRDRVGALITAGLLAILLGTWLGRSDRMIMRAEAAAA